ncbi:NADH-quinone oxidoreductase subunit 5 family protein [Aeromicrobium terrae]|uniref:NADH-quinone oxidoreductase subunit L n=1 Tax=Aeromicrobium terrae TaxID=2498846 RepID=A0A5C8NEK6_9ACTN|nr:proton-conducting transporter membrane subunit [Aeromicrobium terrae]TXL57997.1 NADH-quinone oxidoreductase subunit L [Aeromicrobium terrae]
MIRRWPYVALTAVVAVAVAIWAIPELDQRAFFGYVPTNATPTMLPSLSLDTRVLPDSAKVMLLAAGVTLLVQVYSTAYMGKDRRYRSYALLIVLFLVAMIAVVATDNLFVLLIGWEVMGVCSYLLIGHWWEQPQSRAGAMKALVVTRFGDLGLLVAIVVIGQTYGTYSITGAWVGAADQGQQHGTAIGLLVLLAVVGKSAQVPLQTWLPDAMPGPTPITALIHAATMVAAGVYVFARLLPLYGNDTTVMTALAVVSGVTMLLAALFALVQHDLKRALAWSTVSQLAYMFAAIAAGAADVGISHLVSHGAYKALLFLGCGVVMHAVGTSALSAMGGLRTTLPATFWTMTIGFAALAGIIPTVGFFTKDRVLESIHVATHGETPLPGGVAWALLVVAYVTVFVTAAYAMRLWMLTFLGLPSKQHVEPPSMTWPLVALGVACLALSIGEPLDLDTAALSTLVALAGIAFAWWRQDADLPGPVQRPLAAELGLDHPITRLIPAGTIGVARVADAADREGIDVYPRGGAVLAGLVSSAVRALQTGRVQVYASVIAVGAFVVVLVGVIAR